MKKVTLKVTHRVATQPLYIHKVLESYFPAVLAKIPLLWITTLILMKGIRQQERKQQIMKRRAEEARPDL